MGLRPVLPPLLWDCLLVRLVCLCVNHLRLFHILRFVRRKEAEQAVPVSCEVSTNITSIASGTAEAESMYQTGCLEMLAKLLGDNVVAVILTCVSVMVIQVS